MMILNRYLIRILMLSAVVGLSACASSPRLDYDPNYNFSANKTYQLIPSTALKSDESAISSMLLNDRMVASIRQVLSAAGYTEVSEDAALAITYHLESLSAFRANSVGLSTGLGWYDYHRYPSYHPSFYSQQTSIKETDNSQVKITIDISDAASDKLVWRTSTSRRLLNYATPEQSERAAMKAVEYLLQDAP